MSNAVKVVFPSYTQLPSVFPLKVWQFLRAAGILAAVVISIVLWRHPAVGLPLFWGLAVPLLPFVFFVAPGLWRNLCPLASANQLPRLLGFTRGRTQTQTVRNYSYLLGIILLFVFVTSRKFVFNASGPATALLILGAMLGAFLGGLIFQGKSGWCSSICPLLPVQRLYGQTPYVTIANTHCNPCVGCTRNCYDFNPGVAYLADQYEDDRHYNGPRRFFAGVFPGFILAYYILVPGGLSATVVAGGTVLYMGASLLMFQALDHVLRARTNTLCALFAAAAINIYYWFSGPAMVAALHQLGQTLPGIFVWVVRLLVLGLSLAWIARTREAENQFLREVLGDSTQRAVKVGAGAHEVLQGQPTTGAVLRIEPEGKEIAVKNGQSVLEAVEACGLALETGCRMGVCGADPIAVTAGMENLNPIGNDEHSTLCRLGFADNTRLACSARVRGAATVELKPQSRTTATNSTPLDFDQSIRHVLIVGNGIAGMTAADHVRRRHPKCEVHVIGRERYPLYNRMGISRLIYGRSAMQGLHLFPDSWYDDHAVKCWLNTHAVSLDVRERSLALATGDVLPYDRLILATGASCFVPPITGFGAGGTYVLREADDAMAIRDYAQRERVSHAVVAGAGLLGLEAAYALHKLGLHVTVLSNTAWILNRQLDRAGGEILKRYLEGLGMTVLVNAETELLNMSDAGRVSSVRLADGRVLPVDLFLVCAGVRPNLDLARQAGLQTRRGVVVNEHMQTSDKQIFAAGDVAEFHGESWGLWPVGVEQGEIAAVNALGGNAEYKGFVPSTMLKVVGADVASVGALDPLSESDEIITHARPEDFKYTRLVVSGDRLIGAVLIGHAQAAPVIAQTVKTGANVSSILPQLRRGNFQALDALA